MTSSSTAAPPRRSLILAGGGLKVAFQAGVLQVWLDEAGLTFDHVDGASGGTFNLAMLCQGMSGTEIADAWRRTNPVSGIDVNVGPLLRGEGLLSLDRYRSDVFPTWGLDFAAIRSSSLEATFNVCDFRRFAIQTLTPAQMNEDMLVACGSLPMWFPPVRVNDEIYLDAVYLTDANLEEAIRRGADEIWVIWTVSERGEWHPGFTDIYFQIIEIVANGNFRRILRRIEDNNTALAAGQPGEFGRPITVKVLRAEVPVHYIVNVSADRLHEAVNRGVAAAQAWCAEQHIPLGAPHPPQPTPGQERPEPSTLSFTEEMKGYVAAGETDSEQGFRVGRTRGERLSVRLTITIDDVDRFVTEPAVPARVTGTMHADALGGKLSVDDGEFLLFVDEGDPTRRRMNYRLLCQIDGRQYTMVGTKVVEDDPGLDVWADTSTLYTRILAGHVPADTADTADTQVLAAGKIFIQLPDFLEQLTTFRVGGPVAARPRALARFGRFFLGRLWDVYARPSRSPGGL